ncbi:mRNA surveillance protein pelota [Candidatus Woesearchaeota archaeon]|nr:mRNA surveillance protein pelota [Candidatus Woesearchaeota archaeon]
MKLIHQNLRKGEIKLKPESQDDLWYLSSLIDPDDLVKSKTIRKIKLGEKEEKAKIIKKPVTLVIKAEKTELNPEALRISGIVTEGPEDIPYGSHHTISAEINDEILIIKKKWLKFQLDRLKEACSQKAANILITVMDREEAIIALTKRSGFETLSHLKGEVKKKEEKAAHKEGFYEEIIKKLEEYIERYRINNIIIASPAFFKEDLMKQITDQDLKKKIVLATCSSVDNNAVNEVLKRPEVKQVLSQQRESKELNLVEQLLTEIKTEEKASYGFKETKQAAEAGAVQILLVTDSLITKKREQGSFEDLDNLMKTVDSTKGEIHIINSKNDAGKKLDGLGGIAAILRYKLNY